jgi:hypothetical protein
MARKEDRKILMDAMVEDLSFLVHNFISESYIAKMVERLRVK